MSETTGIARLAEEAGITTLAPPPPTDREVERMASTARSRASYRPAARRPWQLAAVAATAALAIAIAASFSPSADAFARDRALAALLPPTGHVLRFSTTITSTDPGASDLAQTTWIDPASQRWRTDTRDESGALVSIDLIRDGVQTQFDAEAGTQTRPMPSGDAAQALPVWLVALQQLIEKPDPRVTIESTTVDGEPCWRLSNQQMYDDLAPFEAVLVQADYRPVSVTIGGQGADGQKSATWTIGSWETVPAESVESDLFEIAPETSPGAAGPATD